MASKRVKQGADAPESPYGLSDIDLAILAGRMDEALRLAGEHEKKFGWRVADPPSRYRVWLLTQKQLAETLNISERQIQNLEEKGLPHEGRRDTKLYPWGDALIWYLIYRRQLSRRYAQKEGVKWLSPAIARAEYDAFLARERLSVARQDELLPDND